MWLVAALLAYTLVNRVRQGLKENHLSLLHKDFAMREQQAAHLQHP